MSTTGLKIEMRLNDIDVPPFPVGLTLTEVVAKDRRSSQRGRWTVREQRRYGMVSEEKAIRSAIGLAFEWAMTETGVDNTDVELVFCDQAGDEAARMVYLGSKGEWEVDGRACESLCPFCASPLNTGDGPFHTECCEAEQAIAP